MNTLDHTVQATSGSAAAGDEVDPGRDRHQLAGRDRDQLGVPAAGEQRAHLVADRPPPSTPSPSAATVPLHSRPRTSDAPGGGG